MPVDQFSCFVVIRGGREEKIVKPPISQLSTTEQKKARQQWKQDQRKLRERNRAMEDILNFTPESMDTTPIEVPAEFQPNPPNIDRGNIVSLDPPRASSTPERVANSNVKWLREKAKLRRKMHKMKSEMEVAKKESEKLRKRVERLRAKESKKQKEKSNTEGKR